MNAQRICTVFIYQRKLKNLERSICEHFRRVCCALKNGSRISECVNETYNKFHIGLDQDLSTTFNIEDRLRNKHIFPMAQKRLVGQGLLNVEAWRSHSDTSHSKGLHWKEWPARLTQRQSSLSPAGFKPTIPACERPKIHALDHAATRIGSLKNIVGKTVRGKVCELSALVTNFYFRVLR